MIPGEQKFEPAASVACALCRPIVTKSRVLEYYEVWTMYQVESSGPGFTYSTGVPHHLEQFFGLNVPGIAKFEVVS